MRNGIKIKVSVIGSASVVIAPYQKSLVWNRGVEGVGIVAVFKYVPLMGCCRSDFYSIVGA